MYTIDIYNKLDFNPIKKKKTIK